MVVAVAAAGAGMSATINATISAAASTGRTKRFRVMIIPFTKNPPYDVGLTVTVKAQSTPDTVSCETEAL